MTALRVDAADPTPPYEQIRRQLALLIDTGELGQGERLPTVRQLAGDLQVAPGTVSRAFRELEAGGYVETRRAAGTRVKARQRRSDTSELDSLAAGFVARARTLGADSDDVRASLERVLRRS